MKSNRTIWIAVLLVFIGLQIVFIAKRVHNYPFMIYDMYSRPESIKPTQMHYRLIADSDTINLISLPKFQEGRIIKSLDIYRRFNDADGRDYWSEALVKRQSKWRWLSTSRSDRLLRNDPEAIAEFPSWLHAYTEQSLVHRPIDKFRVEWVRFNRADQSEQVVNVLFES